MSARPVVVVVTLAILAALASLACTSTTPAAAPASALPCAVADVLARRCQSCHSATPQYGAPMPLVTLGDLRAPAPGDPTRRVHEDVGVRIHDDAQPMPKTPNPRLDAADLATLDAWIAGGAPASGDACPPSGSAPSPQAGVALSCAPDLHIRPATPYVMPSDIDDILVCYGFEGTAATKRHVIALAPAISAARQLHHVTLLESDVAVSATPGPCAPEAMTAWRPLYGWAPGTAALELPAEAGFPEEPSTHFVVQLHFANPSHAPVSDTSGFDLCTTDRLRANDADVMAFGTTEITIPARGARAVDCSVPVPADGVTTHLFAAFPHMHQLGRSISSVVHPGGGTGPTIDLGTVTHFDLGNQTWLPIDYTLRPGDVVQSKCAWMNTYDHGVGYGPTADDEMCFSYVMYFPKIAAADWHWSLPALHSTCH